MANQNLLGVRFDIPDEVKENLQQIYTKMSNSASGAKGIRRLKGLIDQGACSYEQLKRIKNYFDHYDPKKDPQGMEFSLNGGQMMKNWVNWQLQNARQSIYQGEKLKKDTAMVTQDDVVAPDVNSKKTNDRGPMDVPDIMTTSDLSGGLMEQVNKMKSLIKKI